jgi:hypothetical protein
MADGVRFAVGFTGSRTVPDRVRMSIIQRLLSGLHRYNTFVTGACTGFDAFAGEHCYLTYPGTHIVLVPADRSRVYPWWENVPQLPGRTLQIVDMPEGSDYRARNQEIVDRSNALIALAAAPEDAPASKRSGTWQTVRLARRAHLPVSGLILTPPGRITT